MHRVYREVPAKLIGNVPWVILIRNNRTHLSPKLSSIFLVIKPTWKRTPERPKRRWMDNIKIDLKEIKCKTMDSIYQIHGRVSWYHCNELSGFHKSEFLC
jgi:hypothetical protein